MDISRGAGKRGKGKEKIGREAGCEVVQLHGDLEVLRCTQCAQLHNYDKERLETLLEGEAPECPECSRKADDRVAAGKRIINVGSLRPNIVLYDEMHPQGDAIGRLTHYDVTRNAPDLLLIFGTSLKVIGLKRLVKVFAGKVKSRGGKVVYINATPAPDSVWGDIIDYHIEMDCDAWIKDLKLRRKEIWLHQSMLDKEWKKTKTTSTVPSLKKSKTTTGYESDKENAETLKGQPLVRRKSLSALPAKKKTGAPKKQLLTPTNTPRKMKPKSLPNTPASSLSKRSHNAAFPPSTSPLSSLRSTPSAAFHNTPSKRARLGSTPLPQLNATTPRHYNRIQDLRTPQRPSPGAYSWLTITSSRASSTRSGDSTPTHSQGRNDCMSTPQRPDPDSPFLSEADFETEDKYTSRRFVLDHISVPPVSPAQRSTYEPSTPKRSAGLSSVPNSVSTSARRSAKRQGVSVDDIYIDKTPSPTPTRGAERTRFLSDITLEGEKTGNLPTPPDSQISSDQDPVPQSEEMTDAEEEGSLPEKLELELLQNRPRQRKKKIFRDFVKDSFERLDSDVTEASEQLEREFGMVVNGEFVDNGENNETKPEIEETSFAEPELEPEYMPLPEPKISTPQPSKQAPATPVAVSTPTNNKGSSQKRISTPASLPTSERRRTRGLQKEEEIQKILSKPGTITRREAERRRSLKDVSVRRSWVGC